MERDGAQSRMDTILRAYLDLSRKVVIAVSCTFFALMVAINGLEIRRRKSAAFCNRFT